MAVDPKELLARNKVLVACYVLGIIPIILWVVLVLGGVQGDKRNGFEAEKAKLKKAKTDLDSLKTAIESKPESVYTDRHTQAYLKRNEILAEQYKSMVDLLEKKDAALEKWFDPAWAQLKEVPEQQFQTELTTQLGTLRDTYKNMVVDPGPNATVYLWNEQVAKGNQRALQKKFWVQDAILKALKAGGAERLLATSEFPLPPPARIDPSLPPGQLPKPNYVLPIPVRAIVSASFRDIPRIVKELLGQDIVFRVTKIKAELKPFDITVKELGLFVNPTPAPIYWDMMPICGSGTPPEDQEKLLPEPKIKLTLELDAIDIDMDAIRKLDEVVPPPAPPPEQPKDPPKPPKNPAP